MGNFSRLCGVHECHWEKYGREDKSLDYLDCTMSIPQDLGSFRCI